MTLLSRDTVKITSLMSDSVIVEFGFRIGRIPVSRSFTGPSWGRGRSAADLPHSKPPAPYLNFGVRDFILAHAVSRAFLSGSVALGCSPLRINPWAAPS
jgi:hypothetical protein